MGSSRFPHGASGKGVFFFLILHLCLSEKAASPELSLLWAVHVRTEDKLVKQRVSSDLMCMRCSRGPSELLSGPSWCCFDR